MAWPTARLASCTSMVPYIVVLISQVPKPIAEQIRSVLPKRRCSIIFLPIFLSTNRNRKANQAWTEELIDRLVRHLAAIGNQRFRPCEHYVVEVGLQHIGDALKL